MRPFAYAAALAAAISTFAIPASAAIMTSTWTTTIENVGEIPAFGADPLVGTPFVLRLTYDTELGTSFSDDNGQGYVFTSLRSGSGSQPLLDASITYGGQSFDLPLTDFDFNLTQGVVRGAGFADLLLALNLGDDRDGFIVISLNALMDDAPLDLTQGFTQAIAGGGYIDIVRPGDERRLTLHNTSDEPGSLVVAQQTAAVPEPATWALMIGGFGLAGMTLRRRVFA